MNILYIAYSCDPFQGSEDKIGWCVPLESAKSNRVFVITKEEHRPIIESYLKEHAVDNLKFYYVDIPALYKKLFRGFMYSGRLSIWHRRAFPVAKRICEKEKIDIVHQITPIEFRAIGDYGNINGTRFVCGPLGGGEQLPDGLKDYARGHMAIETTRLLINRLFFDNGLRNDELKKIEQTQDRDLMDANNRKRVFLVAGRMIYRKGHTFLLDALEQLPDDVDYECRIVGGGPEMEKLRARCGNNVRLEKHVVFTGMLPYSEMEREYENADAFIMPSIRETTGTVLLEAMSKKIPVITIGKFGGAVLFDSDTGWLYEGTDKDSYIEALKNAILECILDPEEVGRRGSNARKKAELYTWENKNRHYQRIYHDLLSKS